MRKLSTLFLFILTMAMFTSCGKENESGGGSNTTGTVTTSATIGTGQHFTDFTALQNFYKNKSKAENLAANTVIYHTGPLFVSGDQADVEVSFGLVFCIGNENKLGDDSLCNFSNSSGSQLLDRVNNGEHKIVKAISATSVDYDFAVGVENNDFVMADGVFDSSDKIFRRMLNLDNKPVKMVVVSAANVVMSNNSQLKANLVEYYYSDYTYEAHLLGSNIAVLANPIRSIMGSWGEQGVIAQKIGSLHNISELTVRSVQGSIHRIERNVNTNTYTTYKQEAL
jgi:hypothetical protein